MNVDARETETLSSRPETSSDMSAIAQQVAQMAHVILAEVPERLRDLIPTDLSPAQQVAWYLQAKKTGVFDGAPAVPETDAGKPKITPKSPDFSTMPVYARMSAGYGKN